MIFVTFFLMTIDPAHHVYNIQLTENVFQWNLFISKFSSAAPIHTSFITLIKNPLWELSNGILVNVWFKNWPQTSQSPIVTLRLLAASVFAASLTKNYSTISQPHTMLKPYHWFAHSLNSPFLWFQHRVWLADGVVSWQHNTMSDQHQEGSIGGCYLHLLQAPFGTAMAKKHRQHALSWSSVVAGAAQVPCWLLSLQQWQRCQCNALMMHRALKD